MLGRLLLSALAALACASAAQAQVPTRPSNQCGRSGYAYAGLSTPAHAHGISAVITPLSRPRVHSGHVAAWVGVGGPGQGPNGTDEWLQAGVSAFPGGHEQLYFEVALPGKAPRYVTLRRRVRPGERHRVAIYEESRHPGVWHVSVDGTPLGNRFVLPGSDRRFEPMATAESWDGGKRVCNGYHYSFDDVLYAVSRGGPWSGLSKPELIQDPGYRVVRRSLSSFVARLA